MAKFTIPASEFKPRWATAQEKMAAMDLDALIAHALRAVQRPRRAKCLLAGNR